MVKSTDIEHRIGDDLPRNGRCFDLEHQVDGIAQMIVKRGGWGEFHG